MSSPKVPIHLNGMAKRPMMTPHSSRHTPESPSNINMTPQHEEIIRYIADQWSRVSHEVERVHLSNQNGSDNRGMAAPATYYQGAPGEQSPFLRDFKAVDLEQLVQRSLQRSEHHPHPNP